MSELTANELEHLGGYGGPNGSGTSAGTAGTRKAIDRRRAEIGFDNATRRYIDKRRAEIGATQYGTQTYATDLKKTGKKYAWIGGKGSPERMRATALHRKLMDMAKAGQEIPAEAVAAYLGACKNACAAETRKNLSANQVEAIRKSLYSDLADLGGKVRGQVSGCGNWFTSLAKGTGKVIGKTTELSVNVAKGVVWDVPKAAVMSLAVNPVKTTFFPGGGGGGKKSASSTSAQRVAAARRAGVAAPAQDDGTALAHHIASQQADIKARKADLQRRLTSAQKVKQLQSVEAQDEASLADLEAQTLQAEADASAAEEEMEASTSGDDLSTAAATLRNEAVQKRVMNATVKNAGPFAKAILENSPLGPFARFARQVYKEAKVDPEAPARIAAINAAADKGNEKAKVAANILAVGKQADQQMTAAELAHKEMSTEAVKAAGGGEVADLLPSTAVSVSGIAGGTELCCLARAGNKKALGAVVRGADLLKRSVAGDQVARDEIVGLRQKAEAGDHQAQAAMAVLGVVAAGMREASHTAGMRAEYNRAVAAMRGAAAEGKLVAPKKPSAPVVQAKQTIAKNFGPGSPISRVFEKAFGSERYSQGLQVKLAQHGG